MDLRNQHIHNHPNEIVASLPAAEPPLEVPLQTTSSDPGHDHETLAAPLDDSFPHEGDNSYVPEASLPPQAQQSYGFHSSSQDGNGGDRELFVGDLSYFCQESDLLTLFRQYGHVVNVRIRRSEKKGHSLMHGFVRMSRPQDAKQAMQVLNGTLFMGRHMRVQSCNGSLNQNSDKGGFQIHVSFFTQLKVDTLITEESLRALFLPYGAVVDTIICRHILQRNPPKQAGYGFVYLEDEGAKEVALENISHIMLDGIQFDCSVSHRTTPNHNNNNNNNRHHQQPPMRYNNSHRNSNSSNSQEYETDNNYRKNRSSSDNSSGRDGDRNLRGILMRDNSAASHNSDVYPLSRASSAGSVNLGSSYQMPNKSFLADDQPTTVSSSLTMNANNVAPPQLHPPVNPGMSHQHGVSHAAQSGHHSHGVVPTQNRPQSDPSGLYNSGAQPPPLQLQVPQNTVQSVPTASPGARAAENAYGYFPAQYPMMYNYPMSPIPMSPGYSHPMGMMFPITPPAHPSPYMYPMQVMGGAMDNGYYPMNQQLQAGPMQNYQPGTRQENAPSSNPNYPPNSSQQTSYSSYASQHNEGGNQSYNNNNNFDNRRGRGPQQQQQPQHGYSQHISNQNNMGSMYHDERRRQPY